MTTVIIVIIVAVLLFILVRRNQSSTLIKIENPKIVLLQIGTDKQPQLDADLAIYADLYSAISTKTVNNIDGLNDFIGTSSFDLFHVFADVDKEGNIYDSFHNKAPISAIVNLMQSRGAKYIFFASSNPADGYISGGKGMEQKANIVMTLNRKGPGFTEFFKKIFLKVSKGQSLPTSWVEISPQNPNETHEHGPEAIATMNAGNVVLLGDK